MSLPTMTATAWTRPLQPPAYNAVTPRTTLQPAHAPATAPSDMGAAQPKPKKVEWPPAVRDYVRRAFDPANAIQGISGAEMQAKLKETISFFAERGAQESNDWANHPLPQQILQTERRLATLQQANGTYSAPPLDSNGHTNSLFSSPAKKRKSQDPEELAAQAQATVPPWRKTNLESRMTFGEGHTEKRQKKNAASTDAFSKFDQADLDKRRQRFNLGNSGAKTTPPWGSPRGDEDEMNIAPVVGTNKNLEKSYFRLTAPPKPETVRPLPVLKETLAMLQRKWKAEKNYNYICNQFKSLRQDLTVQHIKTAFTVKVYEVHARISLEKGDLGEYNQCQTQLKALYAQGLEGKPAEFKAYRILYIVYTCNKSDMNDMLAELTLADKQQRFIKHALDVRSALALGNYHKFFKLYLAAENMGSYLMDMFIERERLNALANISRGYANVTLRYLTDELGFDNDDTCREFLESHGAQNIIEQKAEEDNGVQYRVKIREAAALFEGLRAAAFRKVDIKGQI
ncbi:SAC3/GANP/Nin1/mts3/eIF-3 p25 family-domain-containing protein [Paraphoma chrysanthemicola]|nr:SAC3/GANP/Nin1/mts3/eIF-3 p25 family-domain-containing protein [Paraphoma chrysanthemicola]